MELWAAWPIGRWTAGPVYDVYTRFLSVHEYCPFLLHGLSVCKPFRLVDRLFAIIEAAYFH